MKNFLAVLFVILQMASGYANSPEADSFKYEVSIVSLFRNEARFLKEWIEFHLMMGVEHFYLYNHLSEDDFGTVLRPYIAKGIVELEHVIKEPTNEAEWLKVQISVLNKAAQKARGVSKWLAIIDTDEFIVPMHAKTIPNFLHEYEDYGGVLLNWKMFGCSNVWEIPPAKLMIEELLYRAPEDCELHYFIKSIVQPLKILNVKNPHFCRYRPPYYPVNTDKRPSKEIYNGVDKVRAIRHDKASIFHYWTRDEKFLIEEKIQRQQARWKKRKEVDCLRRAAQINEVYDDHMLKYAKKLRARIF